MRKVWLSFMAVAALTVATVLPAAAAVPNGNCNNSLNLGFGNALAITQPTVPSIPGTYATAAPATGDTESASQCSKLDLNQMIQQMQAQLGNYVNGLGNSNCPTGTAN